MKKEKKRRRKSEPSISIVNPVNYLEVDSSFTADGDFTVSKELRNVTLYVQCIVRHPEGGEYPQEPVPYLGGKDVEWQCSITGIPHTNPKVPEERVRLTAYLEDEAFNIIATSASHYLHVRPDDWKAPHSRP